MQRDDVATKEQRLRIVEASGLGMRQRASIYLIGIWGLSVLLRVGVAFYLGDVVDAPPLLTDQRSYHALGTRLIGGYGFSFDTGWYPFTPPNTPTAHWSFLYSLFVAAVYALFGIHPLAVRLVQSVLGGLLLPWAVYRLTESMAIGKADKGTTQENNDDREMPQRLLPLVAALSAAIYAYFILYAATLMTETFYIIALLWSLERALALAQNPTVKRGAALGLALGLATLLRQSILPWVIVLFAWLLWVGYHRRLARPVGRGLAISALILLALILPFTIRNYRVYGEFLLLNSNAGYAMYSAQHPMHGTHFQEFAAAPVPEELKGLNEAQLDRELMRRGIGFVLADPGRYALLSLSRLRAYFEFWPTPDTSLLHNLGRTGSFGLFLPFMLYGLWLALRRARPATGPTSWLKFSMTPMALALLFMIFYSLLHILTWTMPRYRLPVDAVALPFAALAVTDLGRRLLSSHRSPVMR
jgi:hypothetical protein